MSVPTLNQLPLEISLHIFRYLDIPDILRTRKVSRYLNQVSHCRDVWTEAYRNSDFIRPPGPFLSQSAHDLEKALVPSFRVHHNLRRQGGDSPEQEVTYRKTREFYWDASMVLGTSLVFGQFLLATLGSEVRCYDLNPHNNSSGSAIYRPTGGRKLTSSICVSAIDAEGRPLACVVLREVSEDGNPCRISIYLLNVGEVPTMDLLHQLEHGCCSEFKAALGPRAIVVSGTTLGDVDWRTVALDVHSRAQFLLPSFTYPERVETYHVEPISTSTHLLLAGYSEDNETTLLQAFTLPPSNPHECSTPLNPSHRGIIHHTDVGARALLHDAVLDSSTQDTLITVLIPSNHVWEYGTLRLRKSHEEVGTITFQPLGAFLRNRAPFIRSPFRGTLSGTGRAFYLKSGLFGVIEYDVRKNGGSEASLREYASVMQRRGTILDYDPYSGLCILRNRDTSLVEILDLAV